MFRILRDSFRGYTIKIKSGSSAAPAIHPNYEGLQSWGDEVGMYSDHPPFSLYHPVIAPTFDKLGCVRIRVVVRRLLLQ